MSTYGRTSPNPSANWEPSLAERLHENRGDIHSAWQNEIIEHQVAHPQQRITDLRARNLFYQAFSKMPDDGYSWLKSWRKDAGDHSHYFLKPLLLHFLGQDSVVKPLLATWNAAKAAEERARAAARVRNTQDKSFKEGLARYRTATWHQTINRAIEHGIRLSLPKIEGFCEPALVADGTGVYGRLREMCEDNHERARSLEATCENIRIGIKLETRRRAQEFHHIITRQFEGILHDVVEKNLLEGYRIRPLTPVALRTLVTEAEHQIYHRDENWASDCAKDVELTVLFGDARQRIFDKQVVLEEDRHSKLETVKPILQDVWELQVLRCLDTYRSMDNVALLYLQLTANYKDEVLRHSSIQPIERVADKILKARIEHARWHILPTEKVTAETMRRIITNRFKRQLKGAWGKCLIENTFHYTNVYIPPKAQKELLEQANDYIFRRDPIWARLCQFDTALTARFEQARHHVFLSSHKVIHQHNEAARESVLRRTPGSFPI